MGQLQVKIVTAEGVVFDGTASKVSAPATDGKVVLLPKHAEYLSSLQTGDMEVGVNGATETFAVSGGFIRISKDKVMVIADAAERDNDIDVERAEQALERARQSIEKYTSSVELAEATRALARARNRIKVARRRRRRTPNLTTDELGNL